MSAAKVKAAPLTHDLYQCQNCRKVWRAEQLVNVGDIPGIFERVAPGEPMPMGECPDDRALCHETDAVKRPEAGDYETLVVASRELMAALDGGYQLSSMASDAQDVVRELVKVSP